MADIKHTYQSLQVGDTYSFTRFISADDVHDFAKVSGDDNPIHVDPEYVAASTEFERPIVHGVFLLAVVSKVLGKDFPGYGSVAVAISSKFVRPVPVDSEITVEVKIAEKIEKRKFVKARIYVYCGGKMALGGEATLVPPSEE
ncbi:MAG: MaoC family dehydratase [Bacteroidota bacterium]